MVTNRRNKNLTKTRENDIQIPGEGVEDHMCKQAVPDTK